MQSDIERILIDRSRIADRVAEIARQITEDFTADGDHNDGAEITLVPILTGSIIFVADLIRLLPIRMQIRLVSITSYPGTATSSRGASIQKELTNLPDDLTGRHVLVIDDILDSGNTLKLIKDTLAARNPDSVRTCVLLRKQRPEAMACPVDYVCFDIPDEFVVGYGLDYNDYYRNLPEIVTLKRELIVEASEGSDT